jgi:hypothetical protein
VRNPIGGYAWQAAHYLLGLQALGHDVWFYEDTGLYPHAYDPTTNEYGPRYEYGIRATGTFLGRLGLGERWLFVDVASGRTHGPAAGRARELLREADLVFNIAGINRIPAEARAGQPQVFVDIDPGLTQIKAEAGAAALRAMLDEQTALFTYGVNIGTPRSAVPDAGYRWHPTWPPVSLDHWTGEVPITRPYTTVGRWNETQRDVVFAGETFRWRKRTEWLRCLDLPARTGAAFEVGMDVENVPGDPELLGAHGWRVADPRAISGDPWVYRDFHDGAQRQRGSSGHTSAISDVVEVLMLTRADDRRRAPVATPGVSILPCVLGDAVRTVRRHRVPCGTRDRPIYGRASGAEPSRDAI